MATFNDLPIDVQESIFRKKFNLELLDGLKNLKKYWGYDSRVKPRPIAVGDEVEYKDEYATVVSMTAKMARLTNGKTVNKKAIRLRMPTKRFTTFSTMWCKDYYMFDEGSVWCHPIAMKYPELRDNYDAKAIISKNMMVMCDHPLAWLCFQVNNPDYIVHKKEA